MIKKKIIFTISIQNQADKWWEQNKMLLWGLWVNPIPNFPNYILQKDCIADRKENFSQHHGREKVTTSETWAEVTFKVWLTYGLQPKLWKCQPLSSCVHLKILINNLFDFIQAIIFFFFLYFHSQVSIQAANRQWTNKNTKKSCEFKERLIKACEVSMLLSYIIFLFCISCTYW